MPAVLVKSPNMHVAVNCLMITAQRILPAAATLVPLARGLGVVLFSCGIAWALSQAARCETPEPRPLWTTSNVVGTPGPPDPFATEVAFPQLALAEPLDVDLIAGTRRLIIAERHGKIYTFEPGPNNHPQLLVDLERTVYGVTAHPNYLVNGQFFVASVVIEDGEETSRLSRFTAAKPSSFTAEAATEEPLLHWLAGGHNGGCLRFGPDGLLYLVTGDGSAWADLALTGQSVNDLLGALLRIDVDRRTGDLPYGIPEDNPFVMLPNARKEIYSYGHRNMWKFSFDPQGRLWAGDIGQDLWEMIHLIQKGGNYGWSVTEGSHPFRPERAVGPTPILKPLVEHSHTDFRSITGGHVYLAQEPAELHGMYIYGDFDTGKIWGLRYDGEQITEHRQLADTQVRLICFARDADGVVYGLDFVSGTLHRLIPNPELQQTQPEFPRKLSETGLFATVKDHRLAPGVIPYEVNAALWSDGAVKQRYLAIPNDGKIEFDGITYPMPAPGWRFPDGTVLVKTFSLEMEAGNPRSARRLETRILHHRRMQGKENEYGAQVWNGYTYVWNEDQTDAVLLGDQGLDQTFTIQDAQAPGGKREQTWHYPSRAECTLCHTMSAKYVLGVNTMQMNRDYDYGHGKVNQIAQFADWGLFDQQLPKPVSDLERLVEPRDKQANIQDRARSYLHANCSHCHRVWGGGNADFQIQADVALDKTGVIHGPPIRGNFGLDAAAIIRPGHPERSVLLHRMQLLGLGRMPHVASSMVDAEGVELIREWIASMQDTPQEPSQGGE